MGSWSDFKWVGAGGWRAFLVNNEDTCLFWAPDCVVFIRVTRTRFKPSFSRSRSYRALHVANIQGWIFPLRWRALFLYSSPVQLYSSLSTVTSEFYSSQCSEMFSWSAQSDSVSVRLVLQLWLTSACCCVVVIQLWFSCSTFSITHKQLLPLNPLIQTTKTPHTAPRYPCLIINRTIHAGNDVSKMSKMHTVSLFRWFGSIWSDKWTKTASCYLDNTKHLVSVLKAQWLSFLQSWLGQFWLQLDSPTELARLHATHWFYYLSMKAYFHNGIKHIKKVIATFYLTIPTIFFGIFFFFCDFSLSSHFRIIHFFSWNSELTSRNSVKKKFSPKLFDT